MQFILWPSRFCGTDRRDLSRILSKAWAREGSGKKQRVTTLVEGMVKNYGFGWVGFRDLRWSCFGSSDLSSIDLLHGSRGLLLGYFQVGQVCQVSVWVEQSYFYVWHWLLHYIEDVIKIMLRVLCLNGICWFVCGKSHWYESLIRVGHGSGWEIFNPTQPIASLKSNTFCWFVCWVRFNFVRSIKKFWFELVFQLLIFCLLNDYYLGHCA